MHVFSQTKIEDVPKGKDVWLQHVELANDQESSSPTNTKDLDEAKIEAASKQGIFARMFSLSSKNAKSSGVKEDALVLQEEEGWMQKATKKEIAAADRPQTLGDFFRNHFRGSAKNKEITQSQKQNSKKKSSPKNEFLLEDSEENVHVVTNEKGDPQSPTHEVVMGKEEKRPSPFASNASPVQEKQIETMQQETVSPKKQPEAEIQKVAETMPVRHKAVADRKKNKFVAALSAIGHIGLGKERALFIQNFATMLNAGLPIVDTLKTLQLETRSRSMRKIMQNILDSVENGSALWRAMDDQNVFSPHSLALVRIGEEGGNLAENIAYLAVQEEKDSALRGKVKMAMIYPSIVLALMFVVVMGLGLFVLPNLIQVLFSLNVPLPFVTRMIVHFTNLFTTYGTIALPGSIACFALLIVLAKFTPLRVVFQWVLFRIPGIGRLAREATIARFGVILGGLLHAGVPLTDALKSLAEVTPIVSYKRFYAKLYEHIIVGDSFSKSFSIERHCKKLLPPSVQQLVVTGERSGALSEIMLKIADIYDKKASETAQKLPVILEPMLLLFIGGLVGTIAFAIIVPIYSVVGSVGKF